MTPQDVSDAIDALDAQLAGKPENIGVAFGNELFLKLVDGGYITKKKFSAFGTGVWEESLPAYKTHYAFSDWELPPASFKVGNSYD